MHTIRFQSTGRSLRSLRTAGVIAVMLTISSWCAITARSEEATALLPPITMAQYEAPPQPEPPAKNDVAPKSNESLPTPPGEPNNLPGLTLDCLEQQALAANPSVRRLQAIVEAANANTLQVGLKPNPGIGYEGQQLGSGGLAEQHGLVVTQEIVRGHKLELNRVVADRERQRLEQEYTAQRLRVLTDVRIAYYQVLLAQRQIQVCDELIKIGTEGSQTVAGLFEAKQVGRGDVLQAQLETENARILAENAQNRHNAAWQNLAAVVGNPDMCPQPLVGDPMSPAKDFNFCETRDGLLTMSPEIAAAAMEVDRSRAAVERARVEPIPDIAFEGLVNWIDNGIGGKPDGSVRVVMPMPLFNRNQGGIARAEHELVAARQALSQTELSLQARLAPVFEQYANSRAQVERYQKTILPAAEESLSLTRQTYTAGVANYTTLLTTQRTYSQTQLNYLDAVRALRIAEVEIDGMLLRGSLEASPAPSSQR